MGTEKVYKGWVPVHGRVLATFVDNHDVAQEGTHLRILDGLAEGADTFGKIMNGVLKDFEYMTVGDVHDIELVSVIEDDTDIISDHV